MRTFSKRDRLRLGAGGLAAALAGGCATQAAQQSEGEPPALKQIYPGFRVGAAFGPRQMENPTDVALLQRHFNSVTAGNAMKPNFLATAEGQYDFTTADRYVAFAEANGMEVYGHCLVWHSFGAAPEWFFAGDPADPGYRDLVRGRLETYITDVVTHFRGKVQAWDVVNEPASDIEGEIYRTDSPWQRILGDEYVEIAFRAARAADPDARLVINDYDTEDAPKRARLFRIISDLRRNSAPIDAVGHQFHLNVETNPADVDRALSETADLGLANYVTELDVSLYRDPAACFTDPARAACRPDYGPDTPPAIMRAQTQLYRELFRIFRRHPSLQKVTTWGITDAATWLSFFPTRRTNRPLLFDAAGRPKDAFWAVVDPDYVIPPAVG